MQIRKGKWKITLPARKSMVFKKTCTSTTLTELNYDLMDLKACAASIDTIKVPIQIS